MKKELFVEKKQWKVDKVVFLLGVLALFLFFLSFCFGLHQWLLIGEFFQVQDLHHETFIIGFFLSAVMVLVYGEWLKFLFKSGVWFDEFN